MVLGLLAVAAIVGGVNDLVSRRRSERPVRPWAGVPARPGPQVRPVDPPDRYQITYRVDFGHPVGSTRNVEVLSVERPFRSRLTTTSGDAGELLGDTTSQLGRLRVANKGQADTVLGMPVGLAGSDARLDVTLDVLVERGLARIRERRVVLDRPCQVIRTGAAPEGTITLTPPTDTKYVDSCVDRAGLVLAQVQVQDGDLLTRKVATEVVEEPHFPEGHFGGELQTTVPGEQGGGQTVRVGAEERPPGQSYVLTEPPPRFQLVGRFAVAAATATGPTGQPVGQRQAGFTDVWVDGIDVLVLDQGGTEYGGAPYEPDPHGRPVDLGPLGQGESVASGRMSMVRARVGEGRYVRVAGTLLPERLADIARRLTLVEG